MTQAGDKLPLPLEGIRVLDATHIVAGPFCSMILADMGADVIKIERPGTGDLVRSRGPFIKSKDGREVSSRFLGVNRNKKSVAIDLRNPRCKTAFEELVRNSDVLLEIRGARPPSKSWFATPTCCWTTGVLGRSDGWDWVTTT